MTTMVSGTGKRDESKPIRMTSSECLNVDAQQFLRLSVSRTQRLVRCDDVVAGLRGLLDPETGKRFVVRAVDLERRKRPR